MNSQRRQFIRSAAMLTGALVSSRNSFANYLAPPLRIRREVSSAAAQADLALYKKAVSAMKARPASDKTSWEAQAHIHNDFCPHGNWFFLPWHRAYLRQFELICREACGDPAFNLPYWDWTLHPSLPAPFWGNGNVLMDNTRQIKPSSKISPEFTGTQVMQNILNLDSFEDFGSYRATKQQPVNAVSGLLEGTPHNNVHAFVRGNMGNFMSPRDPIFWLHHANVDRVWAAWNDKGHANPTEATYANYSFSSNFYQPNGTVITSVKAGDLSDQRALGYVYDTQTSSLALAQKKLTNFKLLAASKVSTLIANFAVQSLVPASFSVKGMDKITAFAGPAVVHNASPLHVKREVKAFISDIVPPEKEDFFVRVFLDCPHLSKDTPISDPHYVGSFTFFGSHHAMAATKGMNMGQHSLSFVFDITNNLKKRGTVNKDNTDEIKVQLLAVPFKTGRLAKLMAGKIDILVAERTS